MNSTTLINIALELLHEDPDTTTGICHSCGSTQDGCEPDAQNYTCETCEETNVFGAMETLLTLG